MAQAVVGSRRGADAQGVLQALAGTVIVAASLIWRGSGPGSAIVVGFAGLAVIFLPAERLVGLRPQRVFRAGWETDLLHYFVSSAFVGMLLSGAATLLALTGGQMVAPSAVRSAVASQPAALQFLEALLLSDLGGYVAHRLSHTVPLLWRFHSVHHSIEQMDWLASARFHPVDQAITHGAALLPIVLLGFPAQTLGVWVVIKGALGFFVHANMRTRLGPLSWLIANPEFHHWHHALDREAWNHNYVAALPLIDLLLGTAYMPRGKRPSAFGTGDPVPKEWTGQLLYPLRGRR